MLTALYIQILHFRLKLKTEKPQIEFLFQGVLMTQGTIP